MVKIVTYTRLSIRSKNRFDLRNGMTHAEQSRSKIERCNPVYVGLELIGLRIITELNLDSAWDIFCIAYHIPDEY